MLTRSNRNLDRPLLALALGVALGACAGDGTLSEVDSKTSGDQCDGDGGVCDEDGGAARLIEVDCCDITTDVVQRLCDDLYLGNVPDDLIIEDTCDARPDDEEEDEEDEEEEDEEEEDEEDPCAGLSGLEAIFCSVTNIFDPGGEGEETDPCAGLEGTDAVLCQLAGAIGIDTAPTPPAEGPLADLVNGVNALADIANGLNTVLQLLGLDDLFGGSEGETDGEGETNDDVSVE